MTKVQVGKIFQDQKLVDQILNADAEIKAIACHEAAHFVAAVTCHIKVLDVWIKGTKPSGSSIRTRGRDGLISPCPNGPEDDAFVSYAGYAWEERYGTIATADHDWKSAQRHNLQAMLTEARSLVIERHAVIVATAAAFIAKRTQSGWIANQKLETIYSLVSHQVHRKI